jgi:hypothetical protein
METTTATETPKKSTKIVPIKKVLDAFVGSIDVTQDYSLDDLKKLLVASYKSSGKSKKSSSDEKREPSKYNLFVKQEMTKLKAEYPDKTNPEIMSMAAARWREHNNTVNSETSEPVA